ncbi:hypothetical protein JAAARDRAFT_198086 [Jaapia argillacea MUCL 33604]|uniref:Uncharacterized protein n=1 Tax=Jaapia argillacea MUCL 33604 TaxID=933084 RepID=A0A067PG64_9AGAM|nr:hypothetical protein JAAARDRAFT_200870 [Jaapia argillacea MUCL 33604]KDQ52749.1 hypothetical protein JAAARDRAFT_198086 [Jaapia argillacea MUCL 33604]
MAINASPPISPQPTSPLSSTKGVQRMEVADGSNIRRLRLWAPDLSTSSTTSPPPPSNTPAPQVGAPPPAYPFPAHELA